MAIIDGDAAQRRNLASMIAERSAGRFVAVTFANAGEAEAAVRAEPVGILIADLETIGGAARLPQMSVARTTIATTVNASLTTAIAAVRGGAADFLVKPIGAKVLIEHLEAVVAGWQTETSAAPVPNVVTPAPTDFAGFIGRSPPMLAVYEQIRRMAQSRAPVFLTGESGTGKELAAEAIHTLGAPGDAARPFVAINCSAVPRDLMESEIFGHVRGAFTGATDNRSGAAELADGGTLFLDELTEMELSLQAKLLRFVQTGSFRRVGGSEAKRVNVRIVSATNRDPLTAIAGGQLRADLFYRLHVLPIHLLPLRERREDILPLAEAFLARFAAEEGRASLAFDASATEMLLAHAYPGNVRELANLIRRAIVLADTPVVTATLLRQSIAGRGDVLPLANSRTDGAAETVTSYREQERAIIESALTAFSGNIPKAAAALDISPSTIYRKRQIWAERSGP
ncbi:MAG TPA: sigma-54 dependent transcriptional regulator [Bauldia sp.]